MYCNIQYQYVIAGILLARGKHLHGRIISLREEVLAHKTSLTSQFLLKCLYQARKMSGRVFVLGVSTFHLSTILIIGFGITFLIGICFDSDLRRDSVYLMTRSLSMNKNRIRVFIKFLPTDYTIGIKYVKTRKIRTIKSVWETVRFEDYFPWGRWSLKP